MYFWIIIRAIHTADIYLNRIAKMQGWILWTWKQTLIYKMLFLVCIIAIWFYLINFPFPKSWKIILGEDICRIIMQNKNWEQTLLPCIRVFVPSSLLLLWEWLLTYTVVINQSNTLFFQRIILPLYFEELFDSIAPQIAENRTVANSLPLLLKYSVKYLFLKRLCQAVDNLK